MRKTNTTIWIVVAAVALLGLLLWIYRAKLFLVAPAGPKDNPITMQGGSFYIWSALQFSDPKNTHFLTVNKPRAVVHSMTLCKDADCAGAPKGPYPISGAFGVCSLDPQFVRVGSTDGTTVFIESWRDLAHDTAIFSPTDTGYGSGWNAFGRAHVNQQPMSRQLYFRSGSNDCAQTPQQDCVPGQTLSAVCRVGCPGQAGDSCYVRMSYY
jgi:hypothetical protein